MYTLRIEVTDGIIVLTQTTPDNVVSVTAHDADTEALEITVPSINEIRIEGIED